MEYTDFPTWLQNEMTKRGWNQSDLARHSGITTGQISRILSGTRNPVPETLTAIARALRMPPVSVFRAAGLLPPDTELDELDRELLHLFDQLSPDDQIEIIELARLKIARRTQSHAKSSSTGVGKNRTAPNLE
jgi:transcriptional regulator with XRE-family HTH domain